MSASRLLLVDGTGLLYRSFYAIPELSTRDGRPTNAVFGFIRALTQVTELWAPTHVGVVFDAGRPAKRLALLPSYKAQRPTMPDPLREQIPVVEDYLERADTAWCLREGQEADDLIAALAESVPACCDSVLIATSDKDMYQLVTEKVRIVPLSGKGPAMGRAEVRAKTGVEPGQVGDWLSLTGDSSDNIPGVPGVGAKTAAKLLGVYGSLAGLWAHVDEVESDKLREALLEHRAAVTRNRELVRLCDDLPLPLEWDAMRVGRAAPDRLLPLFEDLEFHSMARSLKERDLFEG